MVFVVTARGVEQFSDVAVVVGEHGFQLGLGRRLLSDRDQFVFDTLPVQMFSGFATGVTVFVGVKLEFHF